MILKDLLTQAGVQRADRVPKELLARIADELAADSSVERVWQVLSVVGRALPTASAVLSARRRVAVGGAAETVAAAAKSGRRGAGGRRTVELLDSQVIVDVRHTSETDLSTGIQRVARETAKRWDAAHDVVLVTWTEDGAAMRRLSETERATALDGAIPLHNPNRELEATMVVPLAGFYLLPELAAEVWRNERVSAMAQFAGLTTAVIGFDCVPLTTAETVGDGMPGAFSRNLGAVAHMSMVGTISAAAATEYRGWRRMLVASGNPGPDVQEVRLAAEARLPTPSAVAEFEELVGAGDRPVVVVVGSHEPRKNHMALLHAAEQLWKTEGLDFALVFIGGNSWNSFDFSDRVAQLRAAGRPIATLTSLPDRLLWAAYRKARFTVFPSINEGFGLPIAESLASGTPVVTSNYGSMREIGEGHGALLIDPRVDSDIARGISTLLRDDATLESLRAEASRYVVRTWDEYADDLWNYFTSGAK